MNTPTLNPEKVLQTSTRRGAFTRSTQLLGFAALVSASVQACTEKNDAFKKYTDMRVTDRGGTDTGGQTTDGEMPTTDSSLMDGTVGILDSRPPVEDVLRVDAGPSDAALPPADSTPSEDSNLPDGSSPPPCEPGETRPCYTGPDATRAVGACRDGFQLCTANGWEATCAAEALPADEMCDGTDNNCNGQVDELAMCAQLGNPCSVGEGNCRNDGILIPDPENLLEVKCSAVAGMPAEAELCNGEDDTCDGRIDENTTQDCETACGAGLQRCIEGVVQECDGAQPMDEVCNGVDDNCDGVTDEGCNIGAECSAGEGLCRREGAIVPDGRGGEMCNAVAGMRAIEECDNQDNDCDGVIDNHIAHMGEACNVGVGACERRGVLECNGGRGNLECSVGAGAPMDDICDGIDNNCDGAVDESYPLLDTECSVGLGHCQRTGTVVCMPDGQAACNVVPREPDEEVCDRIDNDCNGEVDDNGGCPNHAQCYDGVGACRAQGIVSEQGCSAVATEPLPEVCDGQDNDCDNETDEGLPNCER